MRIVAIETSGRHGSVAALDGDMDGARLKRQIALSGGQRTAQALAPAMRELLTQVGWLPQSVELVAVAVGPGSFTGLRIGVTAAKTFAYAVGARVLGVNSLAAIAWQAPASTMLLWTILDAQRQELFVARFVADESRGMPIDCEASIVAREAWLAQLRAGDCVSGPPLGALRAKLPGGVVALADELWQPMAAAVGQIGWRAYLAGRRDDVWKLVPQYYRKSAAEEKLS